MQFWNEIINTALLGTEKKQVAADRLPSGLLETAALITNRQGVEMEEQFLQLAVVAFNFRRSGTMPYHNEAVSLPDAAAELLPYCSGAALQTLKDILSEDNPFLLAFWLQRCAAARKLVTPDLIPDLLNRAVNHKSLQAIVNSVCGKRGEWLSHFNLSWHFLTDSNDEDLWQTGTPEQRRNVIRRLRQSDPSKARTWLMDCWPQENANSKAELLKQLDGTVQLEDETWLTDLLNERSEKVREESLRLLKQLPGSFLVKKYQELLQPLIFLKKEKALLGMINKTSLQIQLPLVPEKGEFAPGIEKLSNDKVFTDGEFILYQLMQHVPPAWWEEHFALAPDAILGHFAGSNEKYLPAFVKATVRFGDQKWASAYLEHRDVFYAELLDLLAPAQQEAYCIRKFKQYFDQIIQCACHWDREWGADLAKVIIGHTAKHPYERNISFYKTNIHRIPVAVASILDSAGPSEIPQQTYWINIAEQFRKLLNLKEQTLKAFNE